ncbi:MAG: quinolinate synthase NadA [Syntrophomonadaceae bacterium]|nr:quinolinate synthase NadA [Syntrophomonadaceae bacterium]
MANDIKEYISRRKQELNAVIMAHYYQNPEIQDIADFVGDSLQLAQQASATPAQVIVSCGVSFMAESAKILNPDKTVLLPAQAGCPMADMVTPAALREKKSQHPGAVVVAYVNSSAAVKAESDICCTSSNAIAVINSIPREKEIIFVPDRNLGRYAAAQTGREMIFWQGYCPVHDIVSPGSVREQMALHPEAQVVVHPECPPEVIALADAVRSTAGILKYIKDSSAQEFIVGTEEGFLHSLRKHCPDKTFYLARSNFVCQEMKMIRLEELALSLEKLQEQIEVAEDIRQKAYRSLQNMLEIK